MPWPCDWEQVGCRSAKWSAPRSAHRVRTEQRAPTCGDAVERSGVTSQRTPKRSGFVAPRLAGVVVVWIPLTPATRVSLHRRVTRGPVQPNHRAAPPSARNGKTTRRK